MENDQQQTNYAFGCTEDALTNAIFYGVELKAEFAGEKSEARLVARRMLAADALYNALKRLARSPDVNLDLLSPETLKALDDAHDALKLADEGDGHAKP